MHPLVQFEVARALFRHQYLLDWEEINLLLQLPPRQLLASYHATLIAVWEADRPRADAYGKVPSLPFLEEDTVFYTTGTGNTTIRLILKGDQLQFVLIRPRHPLRPNTGRNLALLWLQGVRPRVNSPQLQAKAVTELFRSGLEYPEIAELSGLDSYELSRARQTIQRSARLKRHVSD